MLEVGWWGWGSLRDLSKNILKQRVSEGKSCSYGGGGFEGVTIPAPPENFNHTPCQSVDQAIKLFKLHNQIRGV